MYALAQPLRESLGGNDFRIGSEQQPGVCQEWASNIERILFTREQLQARARLPGPPCQCHPRARVASAQERCTELAAVISRDYAAKKPLCIGILKVRVRRTNRAGYDTRPGGIPITAGQGLRQQAIARTALHCTELHCAGLLRLLRRFTPARDVPV